MLVQFFIAMSCWTGRASGL